MDDSGKVTPSQHLPFDVIVDEILPKLPVKSLLRFTSTCKPWVSTIRSPQFVAAHFNVTRSKKKGQYILIFDKTFCRIFSNDTFVELGKIDFSFTLRSCPPPQACNGLVLLCHRSSPEDPYEDYSFFNPSLRKFKPLVTGRFDQKVGRPPSLIEEAYGLGFHEPTSDHRVVRVRYISNEQILDLPTEVDVYNEQILDLPTEVDVYSLSTDSWHSIPPPGRFVGSAIDISYRSVFVHGAIHWFVDAEDGDFVVLLLLFDFVDECFREMKLPFRNSTSPYWVKLAEFQGSLAAIGHCDEVNLWVMTEYGVVESWTKKLCIDWLEVPQTIPFIETAMLLYKDEDPERMRQFFMNMESAERLEKILSGGLVYVILDFMDSLILLDAEN